MSHCLANVVCKQGTHFAAFGLAMSHHCLVLSPYSMDSHHCTGPARRDIVQ